MNPLLDQYEVEWYKRLQVKRKNFNKWLWNNSGLYQFTRTRYNHLEHYFKRMFLPDYMKGVPYAEKQQSLPVHTKRVPSYEKNNKAALYIQRIRLQYLMIYCSLIPKVGM